MEKATATFKPYSKKHPDFITCTACKAIFWRYAVSPPPSWAYCPQCGARITPAKEAANRG